MRVVKFGGSSVANAHQFKKVVAIMAADPSRQVIVVSAPGKREPGDIKVTDLLIEAAAAVDPTATLQAVLARYAEIAEAFAVSEQVMPTLSSWAVELASASYPSADQRLATFKAQGERWNAFLTAAVLTVSGLPATYADPRDLGMVVTGEPNDAQLDESTYAQLAAFKRPAGILVVPGFFAYTNSGAVATFSRGGSDITGAVLARGFHAECYENFTDVDGVCAADPRIVANPQIIDRMSFREMRELAYGGFGVLHDEALLPVIQANIPLNLKNTNHPDAPGTMIVPESELAPTQAVTGIATATHFTALYLHKYLLNKEVGFTMRLLELLYRHNLSYEHMPSGIDDLTIIMDDQQFTPELRATLEQEIRSELAPDTVRWLDDYAITMIVGEGMAANTGVMQYLIQPLANAGVNVQMLNEGASQIAIMLGTSRKQAYQAVNAIYQTFFVPINQRLEA